MKRLALLAIGFFGISACSGGALSSLGPATGGSPGVSGPAQLLVRSVEPNTASVKLDFDPVPGAADYRVYDVSDPSRMKYAGSVLPPSRKPPLVPNRQIEWDGLVPGRSATLVVEAVDRPGPFPATGVAAFNPPLGAGCALPASSVHAPANLLPSESAAFVAGSDLGLVSGALVANGRGCPSNVPGVIARSAPVRVAGTGTSALPSTSGASQVFFDSFSADEAPSLSPIVAPDPVAGNETFTLGHPPNSWTVLVDNADLRDTSAFIAGGQFNDVLFGRNAGPGAPAQDVSLALVPNATADFSGGRILHATLEVDSHLSSRRTIGLDLAPATDPLASLTPAGTPNRGNSALFFGVSGSADGPLSLSEFRGPRSGPPVQVLGAAGALHDVARSGPDAGLDNRERWDVFVSQSHFAVFENGTHLCDFDLPAALPFAQAKLYFAHSFGNAPSELATLKSTAPWEDNWIANVPFSDERHWSNAGFEVLPAATPWNSLAGLIKMPEKVGPNFVR